MENTQANETAPVVYFGSLTLDLKCFKGSHTINLTNPDGSPAMWTVILGNNNTGKTTILRALAGLEAARIVIKNESNFIPIGFEPRFIMLWKPYNIQSKLLFESNTEKDKYSIFPSEANKTWYFHVQESGFGGSQPYTNLDNLKIDGYGVARKASQESIITKKPNSRSTASLFSNNIELVNVEEWLLQLFLAGKNNVVKAIEQLKKIKHVLINGILPDVKEIVFETEQEAPFNTYILFQTDFGNIRLNDLGFGYQSILSWLADLMKRMFERYPKSENPLTEPAIVLLDEIDLHLHPDWQRKIVSFLSEQFPKTQFIVTAHSPLIVQSAENINVVMLKKEGDNVTIHQPELRNFQGWTVDEILDELMYMDDKTMSERYLALMRQFNEGMDNEDYTQAKQAFDALDNILHPRSSKRKLLSLQMTSLPKPNDTTEISA